MVRKSRGAVIITSWPNRTSHAVVCASVLTTPLVCGNQASVTIMILMREDMVDQDHDSGVKEVTKNIRPHSHLSCVLNIVPITPSCERNRAVAWSGSANA